MTDHDFELPWFPFYVTDFLTSRAVRVMSPAQVGVYTLLLANQWEGGALSDDLVELTEIANRADPTDVERVLERCFERVDGGWVNERLEEIRAEQIEKRMQKVRAGRASAQARRKSKRSKKKEHRSNAVRTPLERPYQRTLNEVEVEVDTESERTTTTGGSQSNSTTGTGPPDVENSGDVENSTTTDPSVSSDSDPIGRLALYLGEDSRPSIEAVANLTAEPVVWANQFFGAWGPGDCLEPLVRRMNGTRKREVVRLALQRYATDATDWSSRYFRKFIEAAKKDIHEAGEGGPPDFGDETARDRHRANGARRRGAASEAERIRAEEELEQAYRERAPAWWAEADDETKRAVQERADELLEVRRKAAKLKEENVTPEMRASALRTAQIDAMKAEDTEPASAA